MKYLAFTIVVSFLMSPAMYLLFENLIDGRTFEWWQILIVLVLFLVGGSVKVK